MPVLKRATAKLKVAGIDLEVRKGLYGPWLFDPMLKHQRGTVYPSVDAAVAAALAGERPVSLDPVYQAIRYLVEPANPTIAPWWEGPALFRIEPDHPDRWYWDDGQTYRPAASTFEVLATYPCCDADDYEERVLRPFSKLTEPQPEPPETTQYNCGWISPEGEFFGCAYAAHEVLASRIWYARTGKSTSAWKLEQTWIRLSNGTLLGTDRPTQAQIDTLWALLRGYEARGFNSAARLREEFEFLRWCAAGHADV
jgi:hypothetical protein